MAVIFTGLPNISAACFDILKTKSGAMAFCCKTYEQLSALSAAISTFAPARQKIIIEDDKFTLYNALYRISLLKPDAPVIIATTYENLHSALPGKRDFAAKLFTIKQNSSLNRTQLIDNLEACGYSREDFTELPAQYAVRGSVVDIFVAGEAAPYRLYFSGNTVGKISVFDIETQNTKINLDEFTVIPVKFEEQASSLYNWLKRFESVLYEPDEEAAALWPDALIYSPFAGDEATNKGYFANSNFNGDISLFDKEIAKLKAASYDITFYCLNRGELERLLDVFSSYLSLTRLKMDIAPLMQGFWNVKEKLAVFSSAELLNRSYHGSTLIRKFDSQNAKRIRFKELETGDFIVHQEHGIGQYIGMETIDNDGIPVDCLIISFKRGEKLFVPINDFKKVQKYVGTKGKAPRLSSLSGKSWKEIKKRVKEDAQKTAKEILRLEALRQANPAQTLYGDERLEREFADSFPYDQTEDQTKAIGEILNDITNTRPMDRVLIGDVGFGKTEVAMRGALRAALSGQQVLVLVPTTVLAAQHYKTFSARMAGFPINIQMLSRFQSKKEQSVIVKDINKGLVDIAIGTHRLLSKDIEFKRLGLCIIDEEHRFGVKQKEKIKAKSLGVHTLMLSATPIPRTLNQSLSSLRDMSVIETPPQGRMPIKTRLLPYNNDVISTAVREEIARGGQVFYVYNRVESMASRMALLQKLMPEVKICMAHGQMDEKELEATLWDFYNKKYDVLLASTIIESGLDVTNANTLIIENAQDFGLAQLYQLRGRIGRGSTKAYCYLLHPDWLFGKKQRDEEDSSIQSFFGSIPKKFKDPNEDAKKRLSALMELSELGSGFKLALRDLEIRGGGELLGVRQHGYANEVGLALYCDLVSAEVKKLKGEPIQRVQLATVNLRLPAYIPPDYLTSDSERLKYYRELLEADKDQKQVILSKLEDICGPAPVELKNLLEIMTLSREGGLLNIRHIEGYDGVTDVFFARQFKVPSDAVINLLKLFGSKLKFLPAPNGDGLSIRHGSNNPIAAAKDILGTLKLIFKTGQNC